MYTIDTFEDILSFMVDIKVTVICTNRNKFLVVIELALRMEVVAVECCYTEN